MAVLEAMKMEMQVRAGRAGVIASLEFAAGDAVSKGALLLRLDVADEP